MLLMPDPNLFVWKKVSISLLQRSLCPLRSNVCSAHSGIHRCWFIPPGCVLLRVNVSLSCTACSCILIRSGLYNVRPGA